VGIYHCVCEKCGDKKRAFADKWEDFERSASNVCKGCGNKYTRDAVGPSASKLETLDNGLMARAVERHADAERLFRERAKSSDPLSGGVQGLNTKN